MRRSIWLCVVLAVLSAPGCSKKSDQDVAAVKNESKTSIPNEYKDMAFKAFKGLQDNNYEDFYKFTNEQLDAESCKGIISTDPNFNKNEAIANCIKERKAAYKNKFDNLVKVNILPKSAKYEIIEDKNNGLYCKISYASPKESMLNSKAVIKQLGDIANYKEDKSPKELILGLMALEYKEVKYISGPTHIEVVSSF